MKTAAGRRRFTLARGLWGERVALLWLCLKGYRPLARRYSAAGGEIDLVMKRGDTVAFVEVKVRGQLAVAAEAIGATKRARLQRAARAWRARHPASAHLTFRGDAVFVAPDTWPRHVVDAFPLDG